MCCAGRELAVSPYPKLSNVLTILSYTMYVAKIDTDTPIKDLTSIFFMACTVCIIGGYVWIDDKITRG